MEQKMKDYIDLFFQFIAIFIGLLALSGNNLDLYKYFSSLNGTAKAYFTLIVGSMVVVPYYFHTSNKFESLEKRIEKINYSLKSRSTELEEDFKTKLESKSTQLEESFETNLEIKFTDLENNFKLEIEKLELKLNTKINNLEYKVKKLKDKIKGVKDNINKLTKEERDTINNTMKKYYP